MHIYYLEHAGSQFPIAADATVELWARPKIGNPFLRHYAVILRQEDLGLEDLVVDLQNEQGIRVVPVETEAARDWWRVQQLDHELSQEAIRKLIHMAGTCPQWAVGYNCEDFVNEVANGRPHSTQRDLLAILGILGLATWINK